MEKKTGKYSPKSRPHLFKPTTNTRVMSIIMDLHDVRWKLRVKGAELTKSGPKGSL